MAWGSGLVYLIVRLGLAAPIRLALVDGIHIYVGLVGAVLVIGKILAVRIKRREHAIPKALLSGPHEISRFRGGPPIWQRWVSWSALLLYGATLCTGVLLLLPVQAIRGRVYGDLIELHLLTAAWALAPTTWHLWHYRNRAVPYLLRQAPRNWLPLLLAAQAVVMGAALVVAIQPRAASQLALVGGGSRWSGAALAGTSFDRLATTADGSTLVVAGDGLFVTQDGKAWRQAELPVTRGPGGAAAQGAADAGHDHGSQPSAESTIQSLAVSREGIYIGTTLGLLFSPTAEGPFVEAGLKGKNVRALAIDQRDPHFLWAASSAGPMFSRDGGHNWAGLGTGLPEPGAVSALAYLDHDVFASDPSGVFEWMPDSASWKRSSRQASVVALAGSADGRALYAASSTGELSMLSDGGWRSLERPGAVHQQHAQGHRALLGVLPLGDGLFALGTDGVSASADRGKTWTQLGDGLSANSPTDVTSFRGELWAATASGLYRYPLDRSTPASQAWWAKLLALAAIAGLVALVLAGADWVRPAGRALPLADEHPFRGAEQYFARLAGRASEPEP